MHRSTEYGYGGPSLDYKPSACNPSVGNLGRSLMYVSVYRVLGVTITLYLIYIFPQFVQHKEHVHKTIT